MHEENAKILQTDQLCIVELINNLACSWNNTVLTA